MTNNPLFEIVAFLAVFASVATGANALWRTYKNVGEADVERLGKQDCIIWPFSLRVLVRKTVPNATANDSTEPLYVAIFPRPRLPVFNRVARG